MKCSIISIRLMCSAIQLAALLVIGFFSKSDRNMGARPDAAVLEVYREKSSASKELLSNRPQFTTAIKL
jgi:hypothetical protein